MPSSILTEGASRSRFRAALLRWFDRRRRELPWRSDHDPYRVWVSEIMLQQTRVAAVIEPYERFLKRFPNVYSLAKARTASVLAVWSGLGYYRRARLLHEAARQIVEERGGSFPINSDEWETLPGIGRYTAAAIASICYGETCAVVDGNVRRVTGRLLGPRHGDVWARAGELLSQRRPGDFNQAMMELGALLCTPRSPQCGSCPVRTWCASNLQNSGTEHDTSRQGVAAGRQKSQVACALVTDRDRVLLVKRSKNETVMPGMWELPSDNVSRSPSPVSRRKGRSSFLVSRSTLGSSDCLIAEETFTLRHAIMNTDYVVTVVRMPAPANCPGEWFSAARARNLPLTGLARKILKQARVI
jgi:A/G-specific adenine glycosylase